MTTLLTEAFEKASILPDSMQDELARELIEEIEWEGQWAKSLANSSTMIDALAKQALKEFKAGKTNEAGIDQL